MPKVTQRKQTKTPTAQIRQPSGTAAGPDNYDGAANTRAESPSPKKSDYEGPGRITKT